MTGYNAKNCDERHERIETRLDKEELRMLALETTSSDHNTRIAVMERIAARNESIMWRLMTPALSAVSGVLTAIIVWLLIGK